MTDVSELLEYNELESKLFIPNEIFSDFKSLGEKGSSHVAFAYSYYYLISWLYRYAKYGNKKIDVGMIKEILGYYSKNKKIDYLIKKDGVLDQLGYTFSDTDYPIGWNYDESLSFTMLSDLDDDSKKMLRIDRGRNYKIKVPVKGIWRDNESEKEGYENGTFYEIENTHMIPFEVFMECMEDEELGVIGFYLYGYLKYRCQWHGEYNSSVERIAEDVGMKFKATEKYLKLLHDRMMIQQIKNECVRYEDRYVQKAHTYKVNKG